MGYNINRYKHRNRCINKEERRCSIEVQNGAKVILTPRPRRFGKTLNMSMLKHFFDIENKEENKNLFKGLKIENEKEIMKMQGKYPVIFLSFKNQKHFNFSNLQDGIKSLMANIYVNIKQKCINCRFFRSSE